jgi:hypothetical protein
MIALPAAPRPRRRPFTVVPAFIETGVARRCAAVVEDALRLRDNQIALSLPGEGKTAFFLHLFAINPVVKENGLVRTPVLGCRRPHAGSDRNALMFMLGSRLGRILRMAPSEYLASLVGLAQGAGVVLLVFDDAHELSRAQRAWIREFTDLLLEPARPDLEAAQVAVVYLAAGLPRGRQATPLFGHGPMTPTKDGRPRVDLDWIQFERRLDGRSPVAWIDGLDLPETGEALNGLTELYRPQFPELDLAAFAEDLHAGLTHPTVDYAGTGRVRMESLSKAVLSSLDREAAEGGWGGAGTIAAHLAAAVEILKARADGLDNLNFGAGADGS